jgi:hypothetical protein
MLPKDDEGSPAPVAHIAFFLTWAIERVLASPEHYATDSPQVARLRTRAITPWGYMARRVVYRLEDEDLNERGQAFATAYHRKESPSPYFDDFCRVFDEEETAYRVADTWANYDRLKPQLDASFHSWDEHGMIQHRVV